MKVNNEFNEMDWSILGYRPKKINRVYYEEKGWLIFYDHEYDIFNTLEILKQEGAKEVELILESKSLKNQGEEIKITTKLQLLNH